MSDETEDLPSVITVDWEAVEADLDTDIEPDLRAAIEHVGTATSQTLDKWGYGDDSSSMLSRAVTEHGRIIHPEYGSLDARYASLRSASDIIDVFRTFRGEDRRVGTIVEGGSDETYLDGLADLYNAARALDSLGIEWHEGQHPAIVCGSHGPDRLGDLSVHIGHADWVVIDELPLSDLSVEREHLLDYDDHYTAWFRHERYYPEKEREPTVADEPLCADWTERVDEHEKSRDTDQRGLDEWKGETT